ncbi:MAG: peptide ABC transporter permease [Acidimicrobiales bacterium]
MLIGLLEMRRAKARFALLAGAVGLLVFLILFQQALLGGLVTQFIGALRNQSAEVLVYGAQARRNLEGSQVAADQAAAVQALGGVAAAGRLGEGTFTVTAGGELTDAVILGYELGGPGEPTTLEEGRLPERDGEAVASRRNRGEGFGLGDAVTPAVAAGAAPAAPITIVGLARDINYSVAPTLFVSYPTYEAARRVRNPNARQVLPSALALRPAPGETSAELAARINQAVPGVEALTRSQAVASSPGVAAVRQSFSVVLALFYLVAPLVIGLFFLIVTFQKAPSLTLLRAVGAPARLLVSGLLVQVAAVVVGGVLAAALLFAAAAPGVRNVGVRVTPGPILATGAVVLALALAASLAAVRRVLAIDPIDATGAALARA